MARRWRVGILGLGHWYSAYNLARALREYPKATLAAVAWPRRDQLGEFAATFGVDAHDDYDALLARDDVDIVHLAAPVSELSELAVRSARAGKHLILGKPMAMSLAQADAIVSAIDRAGVACFPQQGIMRLRFASLKPRLAAGLIGSIAAVHMTCRWSIAEDWFNSGTPGWFADPAHVPGGAFIDEGIYWIDLVQWLAESEIVMVEASMANLVHTDIAVEDWGLATFTLANGVIATLEASWTISAPVKTQPSPKQNAVVRLEIIGRQGEMAEQWFRAPGRAILASGAPDWVFERQSEEPFAPAKPIALDHLIDCLESGRRPVTTVRDARQALAVALAAYESARSGRAVNLENAKTV